MSLWNVIGCRKRHDIIDAVPLSAEILHVKISLLQFQCLSAYIWF